MMLVEETEVPSAGLPVAEFREHLRLGTGFSEDTLQDAVLESFLRAALSAVEARTGKVLLERDFSWTLEGWRGVDAQGLPVAPVSAVTGLALTNRAGEVVTVASSSYRLVADRQVPEVRSTSTCLPVVPDGGSATVQFTAGFGAGWTDVPVDLRQAVLMLAAHYYEYRHDTALQGGCMPFGVTSLLERYRPMRLGAVQ
ncbi:head-tail connector protein [Shimia haliotis]|uniref:Phage gp6-like head-tail connector protein n=1 Tax=Shimia haliotis TaxID=1280847 RepID=A0A1I4BD03_9RHOB|nr:head-tail connector protein [Shimia haliotis]SFK66692.1 phage conserved hypothetical protein, phiE125 gp8 family [Shimia haliotis]